MRNIDNYICRSETSHEKIPRSLLRGVSLIGDDYKKDYLGAIQVGLPAYHVTDENRNEVIRKLRLK